MREALAASVAAPFGVAAVTHAFISSRLDYHTGCPQLMTTVGTGILVAK